MNAKDVSIQEGGISPELINANLPLLRFLLLEGGGQEGDGSRRGESFFSGDER
jgi:hypothetical protein